MLRIIETFGNLPINEPVDPDTNFQAGNVATFKIRNKQSVIGVCDGLHPCGIIDDIRSKVYRSVIIPKTYIALVENNIYFDESIKESLLKGDHHVQLDHTGIISSSFVSSVAGHLNPINGIFTLPKGTVCNFCITPNVGNLNNAIKFSCKYAYNTVSSGIEDTTIGSGRVTVWNKNLIAETNMYDTAVEYSKYNLLYTENGMLTSKRIDFNCPTIGFVLEAPSAKNSNLRFMLDLNHKIDLCVQ